MQKQDVISIDYFEVPKRFADLINGYVYQGQELIRPEDVRELNRSVSRLMKKSEKGRAFQTQVITADIVREVSCKMKIVIVALESQTDIHYAMPIRVMNWESANYHRQWRMLKKRHREKGDLVGAEFLSGYAKDDKIVPAITIVVYFGREPWDGPTCLTEMMNLEEYPLELRNMVADYPIHLLEVRKYKNIENFHTDLQYVFGFLQNEERKEELASYLNKNEEVFQNLSEDAYDIISVMSHSTELQDIREEYKTEGGNDMCRAIKDMIEDGRQEGLQEGLQEGREAGLCVKYTP